MRLTRFSKVNKLSGNWLEKSLFDRLTDVNLVISPILDGRGPLKSLLDRLIRSIEGKESISVKNSPVDLVADRLNATKFVKLLKV